MTASSAGGRGQRRSFGGLPAALACVTACGAAQALRDGAQSGLDGIASDGASCYAMLRRQRIQARAQRHGHAHGKAARQRLGTQRSAAFAWLRSINRSAHSVHHRHQYSTDQPSTQPLLTSA